MVMIGTTALAGGAAAGSAAGGASAGGALSSIFSPQVIGGIVSALGGLGGGLLSSGSGGADVYDQLKRQKEFAKYGIRWKVQDAKAAGLHPLAALGAQTSSFSPVYVGGGGNDYGVSQFGQDIGRAISSMQTRYEKEMAMLRLEQERARLDGMHLENMGLMKAYQDLNKPPMPTGYDSMGVRAYDPADTSKNLYQNVPTPTSMQIGIQEGLAPFNRAQVDEGGWVWFLPNQDAQEAVNEGWYHQTKYNVIQFTNHIARMFKGRENEIRKLKSGMQKLPPGLDYRWNRLAGQFRIVKMGPEGRKLYDENYEAKRKKGYKDYFKSP